MTKLPDLRSKFLYKEVIYKRASFAFTYVFWTLFLIFIIFLLSYLPTPYEGPDSYRNGIDPAYLAYTEFWIGIFFLWVGVFFKPNFFRFW
mgnify:FL=1